MQNKRASYAYRVWKAFRVYLRVGKSDRPGVVHPDLGCRYGRSFRHPKRVASRNREIETFETSGANIYIAANPYEAYPICYNGDSYGALIGSIIEGPTPKTA